MIELTGTNHPGVADVLNELAWAAYGIDDLDAAVSYMERALAIMEATSGRDSHVTSIVVTSLGAFETRRGNLERADALLQRALASRERELGPDHVAVAEVLDHMTSLLQMRGDVAGAAELGRRALAIMTREYGPDHAKVGGALEGLAIAMHALGDATSAVSHLRRALAIRTRVQGELHPMTLSVMVQLGNVLRDLRQCREAGELMATAIPAFEQAGADASSALEVRGECELVDRRFDRAVTSARAAIAACAKTSATNPECATKHWLLARALDGTGQRAAAIAAATEAERRLAEAATRGVANKPIHAQVRRWLAAR
jgi:tetratricopeptide (TPR) repeat protein